MKFTSTIFGTLIFSLSSLASAKYLPKHKLQGNGAAEYGYGMAAVLYDNKIGKCKVGGLDHIINEFWPLVQEEVIVTCFDRYYNLWPERALDCADGAETFVWQAADECIDKKDCDELGDLAAFEVSGIFCFSQSLYGRRKNFFPPLCRLRAKELCEDRAIDLTQELIFEKKCPSEKKLDFDEKRLLVANCKVVVEDLSYTAELERKHPYDKGPYIHDYDYDSASVGDYDSSSDFS